MSYSQISRTEVWNLLEKLNLKSYNFNFLHLVPFVFGMKKTEVCAERLQRHSSTYFYYYLYLKF